MQQKEGGFKPNIADLCVLNKALLALNGFASQLAFLLFGYVCLLSWWIYVGEYDEKTSALLGAGASMMLAPEDLLPGMKMTKALVTQYYANGAECEVTEFNEVYHSRDELSMLRCGCG